MIYLVFSVLEKVYFAKVSALLYSATYLFRA